MQENRAGNLDAVRRIAGRHHAVQMNSVPRFLIAFDQSGVHIREIVEVGHDVGEDSGRREVTYVTYPVATGADLSEAVKNAAAVNWNSARQ